MTNFISTSVVDMPPLLENVSRNRCMNIVLEELSFLYPAIAGLDHFLFDVLLNEATFSEINWESVLSFNLYISSDLYSLTVDNTTPS